MNDKTVRFNLEQERRGFDPEKARAALADHRVPPCQPCPHHVGSGTRASVWSARGFTAALVRAPSCCEASRCRSPAPCASRIPHLPVLRSQAMEDHAAPHPRVPNPHPGSRRMTEGGLEKGLANLFRKKKIAESMPAGRGPQTERRGKPG